MPTRRLQRVRLFLRSFVLYRPWIPGEHRRGICAVECVAAHLRGFEEDPRSEVVFWIEEWSIEFGFTVTWYCGESPRAKLQRVSSEDRRTPFRGQVVKQSTEMRPVLDFFATAQSFCGRSLQSVQMNRALSSIQQSSCWPWRPESVRTLRSKPSMSRRQMATLSRT